MFRVSTPEPGWSGEVGGVVFSDGVADVDPAVYAAELSYMRNAGYGVEEITDPEPEPDPEPDSAAPKSRGRGAAQSKE